MACGIPKSGFVHCVVVRVKIRRLPSERGVIVIAADPLTLTENFLAATGKHQVGFYAVVRKWKVGIVWC